MGDEVKGFSQEIVTLCRKHQSEKFFFHNADMIAESQVTTSRPFLTLTLFIFSRYCRDVTSEKDAKYYASYHIISAY